MIWKTIEGYEKYKVSNTGRVRHKKNGNFLTGNINHDGYCRVKLTRFDGKCRSIFIHRLVAEAFLDRPEGTTEVNHIDKNKLNNCVENLEWCDHTKNMRHSCDKSVICLNDGKVYLSGRDAALAYGLNPNSLREVARGSKRSIHGMRFEYAA